MEIYPTEIVVTFTNVELALPWAQDEHWQRACSNWGAEINNKYPKGKQLQFIKRNNWVLPV